MSLIRRYLYSLNPILRCNKILSIFHKQNYTGYYNVIMYEQQSFTMKLYLTSIVLDAKKKTVIGGQSIFPKKDYILDKIIDCIENKIEYGK